jgi:pantetheine-phosphate adenylyltransferase
MVLIYPGSFDPVTTGHIDIACRAAKLATRLVIAVLDNSNKQTIFTAEERISFLREAFSFEKNGCANVEIDSFSGLLAEYAKQKNADAIIRGLRTSEDFEHENKYAACNSAISRAFGGQVETILIPASPALTHVSSSIIREAAAHIYKKNLDDSFIAQLVPPSAREALRKKYMR